MSEPKRILTAAAIASVVATASIAENLPVSPVFTDVEGLSEILNLNQGKAQIDNAPLSKEEQDAVVENIQDTLGPIEKYFTPANRDDISIGNIDEPFSEESRNTDNIDNPFSEVARNIEDVEDAIEMAEQQIY